MEPVWCSVSVYASSEPGLHDSLALSPVWGYHVPSRAGNDDWLVPQVNAVAYDNPIPGFGTNNVTNLRLFESQPVNEFNLDFFNEGNFDEVSVHEPASRQSATWMTAL